MTSPIGMNRWWLSLLMGVALIGALFAQKPSPGPELPEKGGEMATPAVDLAKAEADPKLAKEDEKNRVKSGNNLKQIGIAFCNYSVTRKGRLADDVHDVTRKQPMLSWRVLLLPYLGEEKLFEEFKLDEPWDSKHNIKLLEKMPGVYRNPRVKLKAKGNTVYQVFRGPNASFPTGVTPNLRTTFADGASNTILAVETTNAVPWTKPADIAFEKTKALPDFNKVYGKKPFALFADGRVAWLDLNKVTEAAIKGAIDPNDGQIWNE